jgi:hypothetical protein
VFLIEFRPTFHGDDGALMMEAARTSETSADIQLTRQYIPEDSELHTRRRENLKSHSVNMLIFLIILPLSTLA